MRASPRQAPRGDTDRLAANAITTPPMASPRPMLLTTTITGEGQVAVFVAVDHCSAECVGIHAARRATHFEALEPIRQGVRHNFGAFGKDVAAASPSGTTTAHNT